MTIALDKFVEICKGKVFSEIFKEFSGIGTDTRKSLQGQLFIALKGDQFDAHEFCQKAVEQGAAGIVIQRLPLNLDQIRKKATVIVVPDTLVALQQWARHIRSESKARVVGITGSNGKTTTKEFAAAVLQPYRRVHYSKGSFNNHWGLPFSILEQPEDSQVSLYEMGMNHSGEIETLCKIAYPDIVLCTTVGRAHIENFGTIEKIAAAKEEIYRFAKPEAQRIYNLDNPLTMKMAQKARSDYPVASRILTFSENKEKCDIRMQITEMTTTQLTVKGHINGVEGTAVVPVFGKQNLTNLLAAASIGLANLLEPQQIWQSLSKCRTIWGRNQFLKTKLGGEILFDGYNANPDSMLALIGNLPSLKAQKKVAVFAEMLEMGDNAPSAHQEVGQALGASGVDTIYFYGPSFEPFAEGVKKSGFTGKLIAEPEFLEKTAQNVAQELGANSLLIAKGSRGMRLERFVGLCSPIDFEKT